jgi:hypothetical protein
MWVQAHSGGVQEELKKFLTDLKWMLGKQQARHVFCDSWKQKQYNVYGK